MSVAVTVTIITVPVTRPILHTAAVPTNVTIPIYIANSTAVTGRTKQPKIDWPVNVKHRFFTISPCRSRDRLKPFLISHFHGHFLQFSAADGATSDTDVIP